MPDDLREAMAAGFAGINQRIADIREDGNIKHGENRALLSALTNGVGALTSRLSVVEYQQIVMGKEIGTVKQDVSDLTVSTANDMKSLEAKVGTRISRRTITEWISIIGATATAVYYVLVTFFHFGPKP